MMRKLLVINHAYIFFGTALYVGVLWALHFFWFPSWTRMTVSNYYGEFIPPTDAATRFFTIVVPLMFVALAVMVVSEWRTRFRWVAVGALACLAAATYVGTQYIIPVNKILKGRITDQAQLTQLLQRWMELNDIRWVLITIMWLLLMYYFVARGNLLQALARRPE
jgi:glucan phosphoethanolaminetransferase (alkaline phosphatase superfamily)